MPAVIVRRRLGSRSAKLSYHLNRWYWRNRTNLAVAAVFLAACAAGLGASVGAHAFGVARGEAAVQAHIAAR